MEERRECYSCPVNQRQMLPAGWRPGSTAEQHLMWLACPKTEPNTALPRGKHKTHHKPGTACSLAPCQHCFPNTALPNLLNTCFLAKNFATIFFRAWYFLQLAMPVFLPTVLLHVFSCRDKICPRDTTKCTERGCAQGISQRTLKANKGADDTKDIKQQFIWRITWSRHPFSGLQATVPQQQKFCEALWDEFSGGRVTYFFYCLSPLDYPSFQFPFQQADYIIREQFSFPT